MPDDSRSLMTAAVQALIGTKTHIVTTTVDAADVRRVRAGMGDTDPRYGDETGIAPPYYAARMDPREFYMLVPRIMTGKLMVQAHWKLYRPLRIGETVTLQQEIAGIRERMGGKLGHSIVITLRIDIRSAETGELIAETTRINQEYGDPVPEVVG
jgi:hypothetical protein